MEIYERIKHLRKNILDITQEEFAAALGISRSNIGNIEVGRINITNRVIQDICAKYNVNEVWLTKGTGDIFVKSRKTILDELVTAHNLNEREKAIVAAFLDLTPEGRAGVIEYIEKASNNLAGTPSREDIIAGDIAATEKKIAEKVKTEI